MMTPRSVATRHALLRGLVLGACLLQCLQQGLPQATTLFARPASTTHADVLPLREVAPISIAILPDEIDLSDARDWQNILVIAQYADGNTLDVTDDVDLTLDDPRVASLVRENGGETTLTPGRNGSTALRGAFQGRETSATIQVRGAAVLRPIGFRSDVIPAFTAAGCNSGSCHGSASGQDGFMLSLFGFDPARDYWRVTRQLGSRRINLAIAADSLLLKKGLGSVPHTGGALFAENSRTYRTLLMWLEAGAPDDATGTIEPTSLEIFPKAATLSGPQATERFIARARYSDGTDRDVTHLTRFQSTDDGCAAIAPGGMATAGRPGEAFVTARFHTHTVGAAVIVRDPTRRYEARDVPAFNEIDVLAHAQLERMQVAPAEVCDDETFLRRVYLDTIGLPPTPAERDRFLSDARGRPTSGETAGSIDGPIDGSLEVPRSDDRAARRLRLIDELLSRDEFADVWVMKWTELLQVRTDPVGGQSQKAMVLYADWLRDQIQRGAPFDQVVQELLTAEGSTFRNPAGNFYQVEQDTLKLAENTAQALLGMRIQCAQCHNHPFDRWTMDDYYGFAAFFAQVGRKAAQDPRDRIIYDAHSGGVKHPVTGKDVAPRFLGGDAPALADQDRRAVLAGWLTADDNPYFARNLANIVWAHFMGRGIVEPVDDVRVTNPPSNPELLDLLATKVVEFDFDLRRLIRMVLASRTYQLASLGDEVGSSADDGSFSKSLVRRLRAEVLLDSISQVTETTSRFRGMPDGSRAAEIYDGAITNDFLTTFGRATRTTVCSCEVVVEPNLSQALHLINGDTVHERVQRGGVVERALQSGKTPSEIINDLYVRCYSRQPAAEELSGLLTIVDVGDDSPKKPLEDVFWALLNSREFLFNH